MAKPVWIAATAVTAPLIKHIQDPGWDQPLCRETRRSWQWVLEFARPEVFNSCPECVRLWGGRNG